jgi:hypothetical protein
VKGSYEISVETVTGGVSVGKHERLVSLARSPQVCEERSVPVDLIEEMGLVLPAAGAVAVGGELHIGLVRIKALRGVVAGWEVDIGTEGGGIAIAVLIWEADTSALVPRVLDSDSMEAVRVGGIERLCGA